MTARVVFIALALCTPAWAAAPADELAALKAELTRLTVRIAELEARLAQQPAPAAAAAAVSEPAVSQPATSARTSPVRHAVDVGGRVKLDVVFSHTSSGSGAAGNTVLLPGSIALDNAGERDQVDYSARASRIWLKHWLSTPYGDSGAYIELDFFGSGGDQRVANGYDARLRHAYAELGNFLFGQTYSTFINVAALPEHNDDGLPAGALTVRQPLVRWRGAFAAGHFSVALEAPETTLRDAQGRRQTPDDDRLPDVVFRYDRRGPWGSWSLATLLRELRVDQRESGGGDDGAVAFAVNVAGRVALGLSDNLLFSAVGGTGVGRYLSLNAFDGGRQVADGIELATVAGGFLSWQHFWSAHWRSNLTTGYAWRDDGDAWDNENERIASVHANLLWSPVTTTTLGLEWIFAHRELVDGRQGELYRLQFTAMHKF